MPSKLDQLQQQFRQRIDQRKEENLGSIRHYNESQQKVLERVSKSHVSTVLEPAGGKPTLGRRNGSGVDRSRPLKPLASRPPLVSSISTDRAMVVGGASGRLRPSSLGARPPVPQTRVEVQKTGAGNRLLTKSNNVAKTPNVSDPKVFSVTTTTTTFKMEKKNGSSMNGSRSAPVTVKNTSTTVKTMERTLPSRNTTSRNPVTTTTRTKTTMSTVTPTTPAKVPSKTTPFKYREHGNGPIVKPSAPLDPNMAACSICGRSFARDRIEIHKTICEKSASKKRKVYDGSKIRIQGTEAEKYVKKGIQKEVPKAEKKSSWRNQHETFINTIRQAKAVQRHLEAGGKLSDLPPPVPSENPDYILCPHCNRRFNPAVADRHIPKCKTILSNKKPVPKKK